MIKIMYLCTCFYVWPMVLFRGIGTTLIMKLIIHEIFALSIESILEGSFAEVGHVIAGTKLISILTPDMASKIDARHCIDQSMLG